MTQEISFFQQREEDPMCHHFIGTGEVAIVDKVFACEVNAEYGARIDRTRRYVVTGESVVEPSDQSVA